MQRPDEVVRKAAALRRDHYEKLGVMGQLWWGELTDAQKLPWLLKAANNLT